MRIKTTFKVIYYIEKEGSYNYGLLRDVKNGHWKHYYENGNLECEGSYDRNLPYGIWKYYP